MKLFLATGNEHKVEEMKKIISDLDVELVSKTEYEDMPEVVEDADTFTGNALKKARELCEYTALPTIADDSGLVVDVLDGQPGVYSARFAGVGATDQDNNEKLLQMLEGISVGKRKAYFISAMALVRPSGQEDIVTGRCYGKIGFEEIGEAGFGYDPLFIAEGYEQTFAQLGSEIKNKISHRAKSLAKMKKILVGSVES